MRRKNRGKMTNYKNEKEAKDAGLMVRAYDFDGTLAKYVEFGDGLPGKPIKEKLHEMITNHQKGDYIVIFTTRLNERLWGKDAVIVQRNRILAWLRFHECLDCVDLIVGDKPLADEYHDDRAIRFIREDLK